MKEYTLLPLVGLCATLVLSACGGAGSSGATDNSVDIRGSITKVSQADASAQAKGTLGAIMVVGAKEADTKYDRASVRITTETSIFEQQGQSRGRATFAALKVGQRVQARFTGPVAESYPFQATAGEIVILN